MQVRVTVPKQVRQRTGRWRNLLLLSKDYRPVYDRPGVTVCERVGGDRVPSSAEWEAAEQQAHLAGRFRNLANWTIFSILSVTLDQSEWRKTV